MVILQAVAFCNSSTSSIRNALEAPPIAIERRAVMSPQNPASPSHTHTHTHEHEHECRHMWNIGGILVECFAASCACTHGDES